MTALFGAPAVASNGDGRLELFVFTIDGTLWHISQNAWSSTNNWSEWKPMDVAGSWPAIAAPNGDGRLELFVAANELLHASQTAWSNGWSQFTPLGSSAGPGQGFYGPGVAPNADGRLEVFVANGSLWRLEQTAWSNGWSDWLPHNAPVGANLVGPVGAARTGDGRVEAFVADVGGRMWNIRQTAVNGPWSGWNDFGSPGIGVVDRPALAQSADGRLELFCRGNDNALWHQWQTQVSTVDAWSGWVSEGTGGVPFLDHPAVVTSADGRLEVFLTGSDGNVWHKWQTAASNGWSSWVSEGAGGNGVTDAAPAVGRNGDGRLELFAVARDGNLWHKWQTVANNGWSQWAPLAQPDLISVPDVVGLATQYAEQQLAASHLLSSPSNVPPPSWVKEETPPAFTLVAPGSTVTLTLVHGLPP